MKRLTAVWIPIMATFGAAAFDCSDAVKARNPNDPSALVRADADAQP